jgi:UDP-N-acetylmuramyl pentapeptide phosphotransferase/UDP-N-acetylglucosamine-1-phosphate transferase
MEFQSDSMDIFFPVWLIISLATVTAFFLTFFGIPALVKIAKAKNLYDQPDNRKMHTTPVPVLGGVAIFAGVILSSVLFSSLAAAHELKFIIGGLIVIFFIGLKDDIIPLAPYKKFLGQIVAVSFIIIPGDMHIGTLHGLLGIYQIPYPISVTITFIFMLSLINSFNLIDGIDGLASGIGILASAVTGFLFLITKHTSYAVFSFSLMSSLTAFFIYNVFGTRNKIFLGDTGALITGLLLGVFSIKLLETGHITVGKNILVHTPALILAALIIPLFDCARLFLIRAINGKSPFHPDNNHIHHRLVRLLKSHIKVTGVILSINLLLILLAVYINKTTCEALIFIIIVLTAILSWIPVIIIYSKGNIPLREVLIRKK